MVNSSSDNNPLPSEPEVDQDDLQLEFQRLRYQAWLECEKSKLIASIEVDKAQKISDIESIKLRDQNNFEREKADLNHDFLLDQKLYESYLEVAKSQISQANHRAEFIQKASATVGSVYTAVLALSFTFTEPLSLRGIAPTFFSGLALVLSTAYVAHVMDPSVVHIEPVIGGRIGKQRTGRNTFIKWTQIASGFDRRRLVQSSVLSLGFSIAFLPSAYLQVRDEIIFSLGIIAILVIFALPPALSSQKKFNSN
jgi:hypothetical protein